MSTRLPLSYDCPQRLSSILWACGLLITALLSVVAYQRGMLMPLLAGLIMVSMTFVLFSRPTFAMVVTLILMSVADDFAGEPVYYELGGLHIYVMDAWCVLLLCAYGLRTITGRVKGMLRWPFLLIVVFCSMTGLSLLMGVSEYGQRAFVPARTYFYMLSALLYFSGCEVTALVRRRMCPALVMTAFLLSLLALLRWTGLVPMPSLSDGLGSSWAEDRPLSAGMGTIILLGAIMLGMIVLHAAHRWKWPLTGAAFLCGIVVLLMHRTLWAVLIVVLLYLLVQYRMTLVRRYLPGAMVALIMGLGLLIVGEVDPASLSSQFEAAAVEPFQEKSTVNWRVEGWRVLLARMDSERCISGFPFGESMGRYVSGLWREESAHNFYVQHLLYTGIVGLTSFVILMILIWQMLGRVVVSTEDPSVKLAGMTLKVLMLCQAVYFLSYPGGTAFGMVAGLALSLVYSSECSAPTNAPAPAKVLCGVSNGQ